MAEPNANTITIKLGDNKLLNKILGDQIIPLRDKGGNITGFEDETGQGLLPATPTALSPEQRAANEPGLISRDQGEVENFGRPDLNSVFKARGVLDKQIKQVEKTLSNIDNANVTSLAAKHKVPILIAQKALKAERSRKETLLNSLKDKKSTLEQASFGEKLTPSQDLARDKFRADQPQRKVVATTDVSGKITGGFDRPVKKAEGFKERNLAFKLKNLEFKEKNLKKDIAQLKKGKTLDKVKAGGKILKLRQDEIELLDFIESGDLSDGQVTRAAKLLGLIRKQINLLKSESADKVDNTELSPEESKAKLAEIFGKE